MEMNVNRNKEAEITFEMCVYTQSKGLAMDNER